MTTLYDLTNRYKAIIDKAEDGELTPELLAELDAIEAPYTEKVEVYAKLIRQCDLDSASIDAEKKRLTARDAQIERNKTSLKLRLLESMKIANIDKIKGPLFTVWIQTNPPSLDVRCKPTELPEECRVVVVEASKTAIEEYAKRTGSYPAGVVKIEGKPGVRIR